jgi:LmbE family N-acetylglucosaminyl deacetylase
MINNKRVLVLAPHTDDGELGCGATLHRWSAANEIFYAAFSTCALSVPEGFAPDVLASEVRSATAEIGLLPQHLTLLDYPVRTFPAHRQAILDELIHLKKDIQPHIVLLPCAQDVHQDHQVITTEGIRAFKHASLLGYELPWNNFAFRNECFVAVGEENLRAKTAAIGQYRSQGHRSYCSAEFITSLAKVRGVQAGHAYAEAFEVIRWII